MACRMGANCCDVLDETATNVAAAAHRECAHAHRARVSAHAPRCTCAFFFFVLHGG